MTTREFRQIEQYMLSQMSDSAHDRHHIYRVLYAALDIASNEINVDMDILLAACLLHDIGRDKQFGDLQLDHAQIGGQMALDYLRSIGWPESRAGHVRDCICSHRFRKSNAPDSIESRILFDADKLDACGALGIARTLSYGGQVGEPLYVLDSSGDILSDGGGAEISSFIQEFNFKLAKVYDSFYTARGRALAALRRQAAFNFYGELMLEITRNAGAGEKRLNELLQD